MQVSGYSSPRVASWLDWIAVLARYFFSTIYDLGLTKEKVVGWLGNLSKTAKQATILAPKTIPKSLVKRLAEAMAAIDIPSGQFLQALIKALDTPPAGFKWKVDDLGNHRLVRFSQEPIKEKGLARGQRFRKKAFVGVWYFTDDPKSSAAIRLRNTIKTHNGEVFHKIKSGAGVSEFFAGCIVPETKVGQVGIALLKWAELFKSEDGPRDYRLSACSLQSLVDHATVKASDTITISGLFKSSKYNWEYTVSDILNGRLRDAELAASVKSFLKSHS